LPLCELSLRVRCLYVCTCVRACLPVCVCVRVCAQDIIDATGASQRRHLLDCESGCVATAGIGGGTACYYVCVSAWRCGHLRAMDFVCGAFVCAFVCALYFRLCFAHATIAPCASRCPKVPGTQLLLAPQASPHGAAGEPRKNSCYYALKPSRAPSSWARFSVSFSRSADLTFPIFTEPTTMDKKWQELPGQFLIRSTGRWREGAACFGRCSWCWRLVGRVSGAYPPTCAAAARSGAARAARRGWIGGRRRLPPSRLATAWSRPCALQRTRAALLIRPRAADRRCSGRAWRRQTARARWISRATCSCAGAPRRHLIAWLRLLSIDLQLDRRPTARCPRLGRRRSSLSSGRRG
jgi:hypothetical protein